MSFAVVRMQKMKSHDLKGIQFHNQRERDSKTNPDIDKKKTDENYDLVHERKINYNEHVKEIVESQKTGTRKTRKDAVLVNELLVTSDRTFFDKLNPDETKKFFRESLEIFEEKYGKQNIAYATVHMDEKTPHMHVGVVPMREGRLQGKNVFNRQELLWLQDKFPQKMNEKGFELERGQSGSERVHLSTADFKMKTQKEELEQDIGLLEKEISSKKSELSALNEKIPDEVIVPTKKQFKKVEFESQEKNIFGRPKKETKKEPTGNLIVTEQDFKKLVNTARNNKQLKGSIEKLLNTDLYQQNKHLKAENVELEKMNHSN
ncbi:MobV family relaxase, partial [Sporosarcina aquimarina]